jgi:hypothetical protein
MAYAKTKIQGPTKESWISSAEQKEELPHRQLMLSKNTKTSLYVFLSINVWLLQFQDSVISFLQSLVQLGQVSLPQHT